MNRVLREALPDLPEGVKQAIVYYVDIDDRKAVLDFIKENNPTDIKVELRDLKEVLDEVVLNDEVDYKSRKTKRGYEVEIKQFSSDRLQQKIDEYNQKKELGENAPLFVQNENGETDDEEESKKRTKFKPIEISDDGLELIESSVSIARKPRVLGTQTPKSRLIRKASSSATARRLRTSGTQKSHPRRSLSASKSATSPVTKVFSH